MEEFPQEKEFDPAMVMMFEAVEKMAEGKDENVRQKFLEKELRQRAMGHGLDVRDFSHDFYDWQKQKEQMQHS